LILQLKENTLFQVDKIASSEFGTMMKASAILKDKDIPDPLANSKFLLIREKSLLWVQRELYFSGTCLKV